MDKMKKLLEYVSKNIPYYIEYFAHNNKDPLQIDSYPVLSRKDYVDNYNDLISIECDTTKLKSNATSGTTGIPLKVLRTEKEYYTQLMSLWRIRNKFYNIVPSSLCLQFFLTKEEAELAPNGIYFKSENEMVVSLFDMNNGINIDSILKTIEEKRPVFIKSTPTAICTFIAANRNKGILNCDYIRYLEIHSEFLFDFQREMISSFFNNAYISNEYGCTEVFGIAQELPGIKGLNVLSDNVYIEINTDSGVLTTKNDIEGDIVITGLNSYSMPFIRYKIGDRGKFIECGNYPGKFIEIIAGRTNDYITLPNGQKEHSVILSRAIRECNEIINQIVKFKFVQKEINAFDLFLSIKNKGYESEVENVFRNYICQTTLSNVNWVIKFVDFNDFNQTKSKFSYFESKI